MKITHNCTQCGKEYSRYYSNDGSTTPKTPFCSRPCKALWQSENLKGENNPNYGNSWDDDLRLHMSLKTSESMTDERRKKIGDQHRGKKLSKETIEKIHKNRTSESYSRPHTDENKKIIGQKSSEKFKNPEYMPKVRKTMEDNGHWVNLAERDAYDVYADASDWISNMIDEVDENQRFLIKDLGIFNNKTNKSGVVRDHKFSRKHGFHFKVFPEILRHPCNCEFITHSDNSSKRSKSSISLEYLFENIQKYSGDWHEHNRVIDLVESYQDGFRWSIEQFIEGKYNV